MPLKFDWDKGNQKHLAKHKVKPFEAEEVISNDPLDLTVQVTEDGEERNVQVGATNKGKILLVVSTWRNEKVRIVTAYAAPKQLRLLYIERSTFKRSRADDDDK